MVVKPLDNCEALVCRIPPQCGWTLLLQKNRLGFFFFSLTKLRFLKGLWGIKLQTTQGIILEALPTLRVARLSCTPNLGVAI